MNHIKWIISLHHSAIQSAYVKWENNFWYLLFVVSRLSWSSTVIWTIRNHLIISTHSNNIHIYSRIFYYNLQSYRTHIVTVNVLLLLNMYREAHSLSIMNDNCTIVVPWWFVQNFVLSFNNQMNLSSVLTWARTVCVCTQQQQQKWWYFFYFTLQTQKATWSKSTPCIGPKMLRSHLNCLKTPLNKCGLSLKRIEFGEYWPIELRYSTTCMLNQICLGAEHTHCTLL